MSAPGSGKREVVARVWDGRLTVYLDGKQVLVDQALQTDASWPVGELIGIGSSGQADNTKPVRYLHFRVKRLAAKPENATTIPTGGGP